MSIKIDPKQVTGFLPHCILASTNDTYNDTSMKINPKRVTDFLPQYILGSMIDTSTKKP